MGKQSHPLSYFGGVGTIFITRGSSFHYAVPFLVVVKYLESLILAVYFFDISRTRDRWIGWEANLRSKKEMAHEGSRYSRAHQITAQRVEI